MDSNPQTINCNRCRKSRNCATVCPLAALSAFLDRVGFPGPVGTARYPTFVSALSLQTSALERSKSADPAADQVCRRSDTWNRLDFFCVVASFAGMIITMLTSFPTSVVRVIRTSRTLRPLRMINKNERIQIVFKVHMAHWLTVCVSLRMYHWLTVCVSLRMYHWLTACVSLCPCLTACASLLVPLRVSHCLCHCVCLTACVSLTAMLCVCHSLRCCVCLRRCTGRCLQYCLCWRSQCSCCCSFPSQASLTWHCSPSHTSFLRTALPTTLHPTTCQPTSQPTLSHQPTLTCQLVHTHPLAHTHHPAHQSAQLTSQPNNNGLTVGSGLVADTVDWSQGCFSSWESSSDATTRVPRGRVIVSG